MKFFDAFAGIGGFTLPLTHAGHSCIGFSEVDADSENVYHSHFPSHKNYGDITSLDSETLPDFDLLCGGFPCQSFSIAGHKQVFQDPRGRLFFDLCRVAEAKQPQLLLFESVKGLLTHDEGRTFHTILTTLDGLGYDVQWQILNTRCWLPQNRERVFILGNLRGTPRPDVFPIERQSSFILPKGYGILAFKDDAMERGYIRDRVNCLAASYRGYPNGRGKPALIQPDGKMRKFTPVECERLQGFPANWTASIPDDRRYRCIGNAVTTLVVWEILHRLQQSPAPAAI
jgi:DNA (cytosine-5)-methyltransferase 1